MLKLERRAFISMKMLCLVVALLISNVGLTSCDMAKNQMKFDRDANLEVQDYRDGMAPRQPESDPSSAPSNAPIPDLQPYVASADKNLKPMPLVSVQVNQSVPIKDILYELARQADYDIELDPRISGSIIFTAKDKPFDVVVQRISDLAGLRYKFSDDSLRVELDTPYNKIYKLDYLNNVRTTSGAIHNTVNVAAGDAGSAQTGSDFSSSSESSSDFWAELEQNLQQILGGVSNGALKTKSDPKITAVAPNPDDQAKEEVAGASKDAVLKVESLPVTGAPDAEDNKKGSKGKNDGSEAEFTLNKQAGIISVRATEHQHKKVQEYLDFLKKSVGAQVLIEAKVLEVSLSDKYATGINWRAMNLLSGEGALGYLNGATSTANGDFLLDLANANSLLTNKGSYANMPPALTDTASSSFIAGVAGDNIQAIVQAISEFGTVHALASPRVTVLNNQAAVLNMATNRIFFEIKITEDTTSDGANTTTSYKISSKAKNVPEGVLVNVQPSIDLDNRTVSLAVRPTVTTIVNHVEDPAVAYLDVNNVQSLIPEVNVQQVDSIIRVHSGQAVVMGGLLQDRAENNAEGVPVLGEMPLVGGLFRHRADSVSKTELVIFLKATILDNPSESVHNTDRDIYRMFSGDRRPFKL